MSKPLMDLLVAEAYKCRGGKTAFGDFLTVLRATGARPVELRMAEAWHVQGGRIVYRWNTTKGYLHKTAKKTQRDRVIYLNEQCEEMVERLAKATPSGPIFRMSQGEPWGHSGLQYRWLRVCARQAVVEACRAEGVEMREKRVGEWRKMIPDLKMYNFRHTFISDYVDSTGDIWTAARLCGTSVKMIETRYGHPDDDKIHDKLRAYYA